EGKHQDDGGQSKVARTGQPAQATHIAAPPPFAAPALQKRRPEELAFLPARDGHCLNVSSASFSISSVRAGSAVPRSFSSENRRTSGLSSSATPLTTAVLPSLP